MATRLAWSPTFPKTFVFQIGNEPPCDEIAGPTSESGLYCGRQTALDIVVDRQGYIHSAVGERQFGQLQGILSVSPIIIRSGRCRGDV